MVIHGPWLGPTYWSFIPGSALGLSISSAVSKPMARRLSPVRLKARLNEDRMVWGGIDDINLAWLVENLMINGLGSSPGF